MIESFARVSGWEQLLYLWELIVMVCKFLWGLLRLLGGGWTWRGMQCTALSRGAGWTAV